MAQHKEEPYVWTDSEVKLLQNITLEDKVNKVALVLNVVGEFMNVKRFLKNERFKLALSWLYCYLSAVDSEVAQTMVTRKRWCQNRIRKATFVEKKKKATQVCMDKARDLVLPSSPSS